MAFVKKTDLRGVITAAPLKLQMRWRMIVTPDDLRGVITAAPLKPLGLQVLHAPLRISAV